MRKAPWMLLRMEGPREYSWTLRSRLEDSGVIDDAPVRYKERSMRFYFSSLKFSSRGARPVCHKLRISGRPFGDDDGLPSV